MRSLDWSPYVCMSYPGLRGFSINTSWMDDIAARYIQSQVGLGKLQALQRMFQKVQNLLLIRLICDTHVDILACTISRFPHGWDFEPPTNIDDVDHLIIEMRKLKLKQIGIEDKKVHYRQMENIIATKKEEVKQVVGDESKIKKDTLSFTIKSWQSLVCHNLGPMVIDNVLRFN